MHVHVHDRACIPTLSNSTKSFDESAKFYAIHVCNRAQIHDIVYVIEICIKKGKATQQHQLRRLTFSSCQKDFETRLLSLLYMYGCCVLLVMSSLATSHLPRPGVADDDLEYVYPISPCREESFIDQLPAQ